ncbi:hypothetical protein [Micromonospora sp. WMMD1082]|uniref:hypothetical protein n=1 Tax=Micromonospora sp. WMMD1082 TaxID=3016104 RepID=UPI0024175964|nr:hypothetical protein [Micromonospora sp. WMMD1082]MDG4796233.1 hypothetical protein [Micromonospora sp. WMMD1082]
MIWSGVRVLTPGGRPAPVTVEPTPPPAARSGHARWPSRADTTLQPPRRNPLTPSTQTLIATTVVAVAVTAAGVAIARRGGEPAKPSAAGAVVRRYNAVRAG